MALDIGMLGYGWMGLAHSNALSRLPMFFSEAPAVNRHTLIGRDEQALSEAADQLGFENIATEWEDVIDEVDVFYNLAPNAVHADPSIAALEANVPVFCEKPLAHTLADAERMAEAARASDATAGVAYVFRFIPAIQYANTLIDDGAIGEIRHVRGEYLQEWLVDPEAPWSWRNSAEIAGTGSLGDLGAHTIDLAQFLVGEQAGDIIGGSGQLRTFVDERPVPAGEEDALEAGEDEAIERREVDVDDAFVAHVTFENGASGRFEASRVAPGHDNDHTIAIHGTKGSIRFSSEHQNELEYLAPDDRGYQTIPVVELSDPYIDRWFPLAYLGLEHLFVHENYEFLTTVADGGQFEPSFESGLAVQRVLNAIERSDNTSEWVAIE